MTVIQRHKTENSSMPNCVRNGVDHSPNALNMHNNLDNSETLPWKVKYFWVGITAFSGAAMVAGGLIWSFLKSDWDRVEKRLEQHDARLEKVVDVLSAVAQSVAGLKAAQEATKESTEHRLNSVEGELSDLGKKVDSAAWRSYQGDSAPPSPSYKPPARFRKPAGQPQTVRTGQR